MITQTTKAERLAEDPRVVAAKVAKAEKGRREKKRRAALDSFAEYVKQAVAAGVVTGVAKLDWAPHIQLTCDEAQALIEGWLVAYDRATSAQIERVDAHWLRHGLERIPGELLVQNWIGNLPPGTFKSSIFLVLLNTWAWLHDPTFQLGAASGNDANVDRDSLAARDIVTSHWYRTTFRIAWTIRRDADSIGKWANTKGGKRISRTVGAGFTGLHLDGLLVDDPDDADKVWNDPERTRVQSRYTRAIESRVNDERRSLRIVLQQNVHPEDLGRYLLAIARWSPTKRKGWAWFCLPMEYGRGPKEAPKETPFGSRDWRTAPGELLQPDRFTSEVIEDKREKLGTNNYEGQYNQNSGAEDGGEVKRGWVKFWVPDGADLTHMRKRPHGCLQRDELPPRVIGRDDKGRIKVDSMCLSIDCSNSVEASEANSAVGIVGYARIGEDRIVFDDRTAVMGILGMLAAVKAAIIAWRAPRVLIELKAAGATLVAELKRALAAGELKDEDGNAIAVVVETVKVVRDSKPGRWKGTVPSWEAGHWYVLDGAPWLYERGSDQGFIGEICSFPASKRNDRVDSLSQADARYRTKQTTKAPSVGGALLQRSG